MKSAKVLTGEDLVYRAHCAQPLWKLCVVTTHACPREFAQQKPTITLTAINGLKYFVHKSDSVKRKKSYFIFIGYAFLRSLVGCRHWMLCLCPAAQVLTVFWWRNEVRNSKRRSFISWHPYLGCCYCHHCYDHFWVLCSYLFEIFWQGKTDSFFLLISSTVSFITCCLYLMECECLFR